MKKAIIYSAHGEKYVKESIEFANQTRKSITNDTSLVLHTAAGTDFNLLNNSPFDIIITQEMIKKWQELYLDDFIKHPHDQGSFRRAVYFSNLRIATLAPEYNDRRNKKGCFISHQRNIKCM